MALERVLELSLLYDFYGELLTDKQKIFFDRYHFQDLSLNEIGDEFEISPQAVRDLIKRTEKILTDYEQKLHLIDKYSLQKSKLLDLSAEVELLEISVVQKEHLKNEITLMIDI